MHGRSLALLSFVFVAVAADAGSKDETTSPSKRWTVSVHETAFYDFDGVQVVNIPRGADGYEKSETLFTPNLGVGYSLNKNWSVESFLQLGPRSSFNPIVDGLDGYPQLAFTSTFASLVASREFRLPGSFRLAPKLGIAMSSFEAKLDADNANSGSVTNNSVDPVASLEVGRSITEDLSLSWDYTRYFTEEKELNNSFSFGIRYRF